MSFEKPVSSQTANEQVSHIATQQNIAPHLCQKCGARFKRSEHLKRHVSSLHQTGRPKPHGCGFCGKRFSRSDVLTRHHQSCRAAKRGASFNGQNIETANRGCQGCINDGLECSGGQTCQRCSDLGRDCTGKLDGQHAAWQNTASGLPSPVTDHLHTDGEGLGRSPTRLHELSKDHSAHESSLPSRLTSSGSSPLSSQRPEVSTIRTTNELQLSNSSESASQTHSMQGQNNFAQVLGENPLNGLRPPFSHRALSFPSTGTAGSLSQENDTIVVASSNSNNPEQSLREERAANKRGRYVSNACIHCQRRKVKCSGERTCNQCRSWKLVCEYNHGRKRRATVNAEQRRSVLPAVKVSPVLENVLADDSSLTESLKQMMERIASLERNCSILRDQVATNKDDQDESSFSDWDDEENGDESSSNPESLPGLPTQVEAFHGATSLLEPIDRLDRTFANERNEEPTSRVESSATSPRPITWDNLPRGEFRGIETIEAEMRANDATALRSSIDIFFSSLNPHYPCLNENQFRAQFEAFLANNVDVHANQADRHQFVALMNLMQAEVAILNDNWSHSSHAPAWDKFCRAESILNRLTWLGNGNLLTIQCLLIKARYLLYSEKALGAYDAMGRVVRICWHLGLHDQPSWTGCSPFEIVMRQRIFWTIFYVERNIAFNAGAPYLIREADFNVDLPPNFADKDMSPYQPLPTEENVEWSSSPYVGAVVKWGRLCAEIWDAVFGVRAKKPTSREFIATMDARIQYAVSEFPAHLQWQGNADRLTGLDQVPVHIIRQTAILHLRMNQLRLLLRQDSILSLVYDDSMAKICVSIATDSIDAISAGFASPYHKPTDRFSSCLYLVGSLLPLVCIIAKHDNDPLTRSKAIDAFQKDLALLQEMAPNFSAARHSLRRLHRVIKTTVRAIEKSQDTGEMALDSNGSEPEAIVPQLTEFFNHDYQIDFDMNAFNDQSNNAFGYQIYNTSNMMDLSFSGATDAADTFWMDNDFFNRGRMMLQGDQPPRQLTTTNH